MSGLLELRHELSFNPTLPTFIDSQNQYIIQINNFDIKFISWLKNCSFSASFPYLTNVREMKNAKLSKDEQTLLLQFNNEIRVFVAEMRSYKESFRVLKDSLIMCEFLNEELFLLVNRTGVEILKIQKNAFSVASSKTLVASNSKTLNIFNCKSSKLKASKIHESANSCHFAISNLYGTNYFILIDVNAVPLPELKVYTFEDVLLKSWKIANMDDYLINFVDNLIVLTCLNLKMTFCFDIKEEFGGIPSTKFDVTNRIGLTSVDGNLILSKDGNLFSLVVNLECLSIYDPIELISTLLRRTNSRIQTLQEVKKIILQNTPLNQISKILFLFQPKLIKSQQPVFKKFTPEDKENYHPHVAIDPIQDDLYFYVFKPISEDHNLSLAYKESIFMIQLASHRSENVEKLLIKVLALQQKYYQLKLLFENQFFEESLQTAQFLMSLEGCSEIGKRLLRKLEHFDDLVEILLDSMKVEDVNEELNRLKIPKHQLNFRLMQRIS